MGKANRSSRGPTVDNHKGYNVRQMVGSKTDDKKVTRQVHTGKYGIYAGKKLLTEISKKEEGRPTIEKIVSGELKFETK